jgi:hypothetical protein
VLDAHGSPTTPNEDAAAQKLLWRIVVGVEAVGGLAVRLKRYWAVRALAMPSAALSKQIREPSWIRHALTAASWARLLYTQPAGEDAQPVEIGGPVVALARQLVERIPALRPDTEVSRFELNTAPEPFDKVLDSLTRRADATTTSTRVSPRSTPTGLSQHSNCSSPTTRSARSSLAKMPTT